MPLSGRMDKESVAHLHIRVLFREPRQQMRILRETYISLNTWEVEKYKISLGEGLRGWETQGGKKKFRAQ